MLNCIYVGLGGFVGAVLRYLLSLLPLSANTHFPYTTLLINVLGGLAIGAFQQSIAGNLATSPALALFVQVGICGGFTTFSTFALENLRFLENGRYLTLFIYVLASVTLCVAAVWLGKWGLKSLLAWR